MTYSDLSWDDKKFINRVLQANPTLLEIETHLKHHRLLEPTLDEAQRRLDKFERQQIEQTLDDTDLFVVDNRDNFAANVENGLWNLDELEIAEYVNLKTNGEAFIGEANLDDASPSRDLRVLLTPSKDGRVVMATHENVGKVDKAFRIKKALGCDDQMADEFQLFFKKLGLSVDQGIDSVLHGMRFSGNLKKFRDIKQAWSYFNNLAAELDSISPVDLHEIESDGFNRPSVAYHKMGEPENQPEWRPRKKLQTMLDYMEGCSYQDLKAFGSKMVKHKFDTWAEGSIFWSEYRKLKARKDPYPRHTRLGQQALDRIAASERKGGKPIKKGQLKIFLRKNGKNGSGRLNEKDLNALWAWVNKK